MSNLILIGIIFFLNIQFSYSIRCKGEMISGNYYDTDFFIIESKQEPKEFKYLYPVVDSVITKDIQSEEDDILAHFEKTLQLFDIKSYSNIIYNDESGGIRDKVDPLNPLNEKYGVAKGALIWNVRKGEGIWIALGQDQFLCFSLNNDEIIKIFKYLFFLNVNVQKKYLDEKIKKIIAEEKKNYEKDLSKIFTVWQRKQNEKKSFSFELNKLFNSLKISIEGKKFEEKTAKSPIKSTLPNNIFMSIIRRFSTEYSDFFLKSEKKLNPINTKTSIKIEDQMFHV